MTVEFHKLGDRVGRCKMPGRQKENNHLLPGAWLHKHILCEDGEMRFFVLWGLVLLFFPVEIIFLQESREVPSPHFSPLSVYMVAVCTSVLTGHSRITDLTLLVWKFMHLEGSPATSLL